MVHGYRPMVPQLECFRRQAGAPPPSPGFSRRVSRGDTGPGCVAGGPCARKLPRVRQLNYRIADGRDFDAIHRLNYQTFVEEIPQHPPNAERLLIDRFHAENTYAICVAEDQLVGMACGRCERPFSLDLKLPGLDRWLPPHRKAVEIRLLSVTRNYRAPSGNSSGKSSVFFGLITFLSSHFLELGCDLALISGTVRQLRLYRHLGFEPFGERVGSAEAAYQPMFLTLDAFTRVPAMRRHPAWQ